MSLLVAAQIVLAAEEERSGLDVILPDLAELIWGLVGFVILFVILQKFAFPKMNTMLEERQANIQGKLEEAESERQKAEQLRRQYEAQLGEARDQSNRIVEEAKAQGERLRADIVRKAEEESAQIVARAREDVEAERSRFVQDLRGQVAVLSVELASKIVQRELDPSQHQALVDQYINELSGLN